MAEYSSSNDEYSDEGVSAVAYATDTVLYLFMVEKSVKSIKKSINDNAGLTEIDPNFYMTYELQTYVIVTSQKFYHS